MLAPSWFCFGILYVCLMVTGGATTVNNVTAPAWCAGEQNFYCHKSDECRPAYVRCDKTKQCEEGEDEDDCPTCTKESAASLGKFYCQQSGECISIDWKCDGMPDCDDGEDEADALCPEDSDCSVNQFDCGGGHCIDADWRCDSQPDCQGGEDEKNCETTCSADQLSCTPSGAEGHSASLECISKDWLCDQEKDCLNGEDEVNCPVIVCPDERFNCSAEHKCMPNEWMCDNELDCESGEDEANCPDEEEKTLVPSQICTDLEFKCTSGAVACIIGVWKCDKQNDCDDGSDELDCPSDPKCSRAEFMCDNGDCIPSFLVCSGNEECEGGEDETQPSCATTLPVTCDPEKEFICDNSTREPSCIDMSKVCDGKDDCENHRDESQQQCGAHVIPDPCQFKETCPGEHVLCKTIRTNLTSNLNRTVGYVCSCAPGYVRDGNNNCVDDDECSKVESPVCDQLCTNELGSYKCACTEGYSLATDNRSCLVDSTSVHPKLLFTNRHQIRSIRIHGQGEYMPLVDSSAAVALDFDYSRQEVFYSDLGKKKLFKFKLPPADSDADLTEEDLNIPGVDTPDGLAYDWIYRHLYWADTASNTINMACMDEKAEEGNSKVLYKNKNPNCNKLSKEEQGMEVCIDEPRALAVHPRKGWIFWSDWGIHPHIVLAALDGSRMQKIAYNINSEKQYLNWPNGLALDISSDNERLYWIDAQLHTIFSCSIDRCITDINVLVYDTENIKHPYSITAFENKLYWTDWAHRHIVSANKYTGGNITRVLGDLEQPMDLKVFHPLSQQKSTNHCEQPIGEEPLCQHICAPKPWSRPLGSNDDFLPVEGEVKYSCLCADGYVLGANGRNCSKVMVPVKPGAHVAPIGTVGNIGTAGNNGTTGISKSGKVAVIASCSVFVIGLVAALISVLFVRRMRQNKAKDMNFDNPVYKRTTEDKLELPRHEYQPSQSDPTLPESTSTESCVDVHVTAGDSATDII
ncbi:low-density lipoprotein receptor-like isoform X1 [Watersipora subatra]|uniref:low-density lipoprotein receptor-like isoform X1 n=1 Tax=Watersipora subatra TaxID=2589382 RepID=UPI00355B9CFC